MELFNLKKNRARSLARSLGSLTISKKWGRTIFRIDEATNVGLLARQQHKACSASYPLGPKDSAAFPRI